MGLNNKFEEREEPYTRMAGAVQQFVIVVGTAASVDAAHTHVNGTLWKLGSVLNALDVCFKAFFALHSAYLPEAYLIWLFSSTCVVRYPAEERKKCH